MRAICMQDKGVDGEVSIDWAELMRFKREFTDPIPEKNANSFECKGIDTSHGQARFTGRNSLEVEGQTLEARYILIATGAEPATLGIPGEEHLVARDDFLELEELPPRIVLVGGGYIAAEFPHLAARVGAHVTILSTGSECSSPSIRTPKTYNLHCH